MQPEIMEILESSRKVAESIERLDDMECICDCAKSVTITPEDSQTIDRQYTPIQSMISNIPLCSTLSARAIYTGSKTTCS